GVKDRAVGPALIGEQGHDIVLHEDLSWAGTVLRVLDCSRCQASSGAPLSLYLLRSATPTDFRLNCRSNHRLWHSIDRGITYRARFDMPLGAAARTSCMLRSMPRDGSRQRF